MFWKIKKNTNTHTLNEWMENTENDTYPWRRKRAFQQLEIFSLLPMVLNWHRCIWKTKMVRTNNREERKMHREWIINKSKTNKQNNMQNYTKCIQCRECIHSKCVQIKRRQRSDGGGGCSTSSKMNKKMRNATENSGKEAEAHAHAQFEKFKRI